ncbi:MAG: spore photoproduct lyase family protein [Pseudomonadota bacterium]
MNLYEYFKDRNPSDKQRRKTEKYFSSILNFFDDLTKYPISVNNILLIGELIEEIRKREKITREKIIDDIEFRNIEKDYSNVVEEVKKRLRARRYPVIAGNKGINSKFKIQNSKLNTKCKTEYRPKFVPETIIIDPKSCNDLIAKNALKYAQKENIEVIEPNESPTLDFWRDYFAESVNPILKGKKTIFLTRSKGKFARRCPGTKKMICCNYHNFDIGSNCPFDCSYCILQYYLNLKPIAIYTNLADLEKELELEFKNKFLRVGPGNLTDSLGTDHITNYSSSLIKITKNHPSCLIEFKTKSDYIENILRHKKNASNIVISWSLNTNRIIESDELYTASLEQRLNAAKACLQNGFKLAFHFDPIVIYPGFEEEYSYVIDKLFSIFESKSQVKKLVWLSLGCFRFDPKLKDIINERFENSVLPLGEFTLHSDRKYRYYEPLRIKAFQALERKIKSYYPDCPVYLCMEDKKMWKQVLNKLPKEINNSDLLY